MFLFVDHPLSLSFLPPGGGVDTVSTGRAEEGGRLLPHPEHQVHCRRHKRTLRVSGRVCGEGVVNFKETFHMMCNVT